MRFEFATVGRVLFGAGTLQEIGPIARNMGRHALVVTGRNPERAARLISVLQEQGLSHTILPVAGEPTIDMVCQGVARAREQNCDLVIGFGGGSAVDAGKAIAALLKNQRDIFEYLEVVGQGKPLAVAPAPYIAIPTTAGAGAEATRNAVLASPEHRVKVSLRSPLMLPRLAVIDPELTHDLPLSITASTGLDALTQLIEPFVSVRANPLTDSLCREGMARVGRSLRRAYEKGDDAAAREDMSLASVFGGMALANAALGAVHGFAAPIGGMFPAPHGAVCAALLPHVMEVNVRALSQRAAGSEPLRRFEEIASILTSKAQATVADGVNWVRDACAALQIPPLRAYKIAAGDLPAICDKAAVASSMKGNPLALSRAEMQQILERAL